MSVLVYCYQTEGMRPWHVNSQVQIYQETSTCFRTHCGTHKHSMDLLTTQDMTALHNQALQALRYTAIFRFEIYNGNDGNFIQEMKAQSLWIFSIHCGQSLRRKLYDLSVLGHLWYLCITMPISNIDLKPSQSCIGARHP